MKPDHALVCDASSVPKSSTAPSPAAFAAPVSLVFDHGSPELTPDDEQDIHKPIHERKCRRTTALVRQSALSRPLPDAATRDLKAYIGLIYNEVLVALRTPFRAGRSSLHK